VVATQNHDQVGNRATGERLVALTTEGRARIAAALLLTSPFVPLLFQGEEWAASTPFLYFTHHADPDLAQAVRDGRRAEFAAFGWPPDAVPDPQAEATFQRSKLRWEERDDPGHAGMLTWYRELLALRRAEPDLHDPSQPARASHHDGLLTVQRGRIRLHANLGSGPHTVPKAAEDQVSLVFPEQIDTRGREVVLPVDSVMLLTTTAPPPSVDG
jgi:maltooligosyltrehalose trehalohydrolase